MNLLGRRKGDMAWNGTGSNPVIESRVGLLRRNLWWCGTYMNHRTEKMESGMPFQCMYNQEPGTHIMGPWEHRPTDMEVQREFIKYMETMRKQGNASVEPKPTGTGVLELSKLEAETTEITVPGFSGKDLVKTKPKPTIVSI